MLQKQGHKFESETDTEVLAHLIEAAFDGKLEEAVIDALTLVEGTYGIAVISSRDPDKIVARAQGQPAARRPRRRRVLRRERRGGDPRSTRARSCTWTTARWRARRRDGYQVLDLDARRVKKGVSRIDWDLDEIEKGGFEHFMLKEIFEQPETIAEHDARPPGASKKGSRKLGGLNLTKDELLSFDQHHHHRLRHRAGTRR